MKKNIFLILVIGLAFSCSSGTNHKEESSDNSLKQAETIEKSIEKLDESIQDSEIEMEKTQNEIDTLLNNI